MQISNKMTELQMCDENGSFTALSITKSLRQTCRTPTMSLYEEEKKFPTNFVYFDKFQKRFVSDITAIHFRRTINCNKQYREEIKLFYYITFAITKHELI